ncbi:multiheme c-type cytochrome [Halomonas sp. 25-S5]|uniref:multiheme c-type cytochrome n=1 Tax=Halomonas sp. 25-S5 TaxID=2994065 RepID=UPI0024694077|nr:multiheme c-type cytochrome [Halomonas sp. 25-S5]
MPFKSQFRYHARPIVLSLILSGIVIAGLSLTLSAPDEPGVALEDVPYYQLPFGPDAAGDPRPFWPSRMQTASGRFADPEAISSSAECATCHQQEFDEWLPSLHAYAGLDNVYEKTVEANEDLLRHGVEQGRFCEGCHSPAELLTGRTNRFASVMPSDAAAEGVNCIACHTAVHADPEQGNGALTLTLESSLDQLSGPLLVAAPRDHAHAFGAERTNALIKTPEFCGSCHTEILDASMSQSSESHYAQATFQEWQGSWYEKNNVTCQDCHMAPDPASYVQQLRNGHIAKPERYTHRFVGANYLLFDTSLGSNLAFLRGGFLPGMSQERQLELIEEQGEATRALLRAAAGLELRNARRDDGALHVDIAVQNLGAGHNLPTGVLDQKHMWLEVQLRNTEGRVVYHSGAYDADTGNVDAAAVRWMEVFRNRDGQPILDHLTFRTAAIDWERKTIPPRGEDVVGYDIPLPEGDTGPYAIEAHLWYTVALPELLFNNLRVEMPVPPFELADFSAEISRP